MKLDRSFAPPPIQTELSFSCLCHLSSAAGADSPPRTYTHTHLTGTQTHTEIGRSKISDLSARGWLGVKGSEQRHGPKSSVPASPSAAMHAARTYIEYYQVSRSVSYHAVNISHMYGTDSVPFLQGEIRTRPAAAKSTRARRGLTHSRPSHCYINIINYGTPKPRQSRFVLENTTEALLALDMASSASRRMAHATHATLWGGGISSPGPLPVPSHLVPPRQTMHNSNS